MKTATTGIVVKAALSLSLLIPVLVGLGAGYTPSRATVYYAYWAALGSAATALGVTTYAAVARNHSSLHVGVIALGAIGIAASAVVIGMCVLAAILVSSRP